MSRGSPFLNQQGWCLELAAKGRGVHGVFPSLISIYEWPHVLGMRFSAMYTAEGVLILYLRASRSTPEQFGKLLEPLRQTLNLLVLGSAQRIV